MARSGSSSLPTEELFVGALMVRCSFRHSDVYTTDSCTAIGGKAIYQYSIRIRGYTISAALRTETKQESCSCNRVHLSWRRWDGSNVRRMTKHGPHVRGRGDKLQRATQLCAAIERRVGCTRRSLPCTRPPICVPSGCGPRYRPYAHADAQCHAAMLRPRPPLLPRLRRIHAPPARAPRTSCWAPS
jgi:hypothetical protein